MLITKLRDLVLHFSHPIYSICSCFRLREQETHHHPPQSPSALGPLRVSSSAPLLYSLCTSNCVATSDSNRLLTFSKDMVVLGQSLLECEKTKELFMDFGRTQTRDYSHLKVVLMQAMPTLTGTCLGTSYSEIKPPVWLHSC